MINGVGHDLRIGFRQLARSPGFALATVLILGVGVGSATAIFSIVNSVLLRPLPFPDSERIVRLNELNQAGRTIRVSYPNYRDFAEQASSFESIAATAGQTQAMSANGKSRRIWGVLFHGDPFAIYGLETSRGRGFTQREIEIGAPLVVVSGPLAESVWGAADAAVGKTLELSGHAFTVVGVLAPAVDERVDLWLPASVLGADTTGRNAQNWTVIAKIRPGLSVAAAEAELKAIYARLRQQHGEESMRAGAAITTLLDATVASSRDALTALSAAVGLLLVIACANIASLLLARGAGRRSEVALRQALGAGRGRILRQLVVENVPLAALGGVLGLLLAHWSFTWLVSLLPPGIPRRAEITMDWTALAFGIGIALVCGLLFALVPALRVTTDSAGGLRSGVRSVVGADAKAGRALVTSQLALALTLLTCSGLLLRSLVSITQVDPGFDYQRTLLAETTLPEAAYPDDADMTLFWENALARINALPEVEVAGLGFSAPLEGSWPNGAFDYLDGEERTGDAHYGIATTDYFRALDIPLIRGRLFEQTDTAQAPSVAVINQAAAESLWAGEDPLGKRLAFKGMDVYDPVPLTVVGVVGDVRNRSLTLEPTPQVYVNYFQRPARARDADLVVRSSNPGFVVDRIRTELLALDPSLAIRFQTTETSINASLARPRLRAGLIGFFALCAITLSALGLFSSMAYRVSRRTREIGVRMALGASASSVQGNVLGEGLRMAAVGAVIGCLLALAAGRLLASLLFGVTATDPITFAAAAGLLFAVTLLAAFVPARRAAATSPATALRHE